MTGRATVAQCCASAVPTLTPPGAPDQAGLARRRIGQDRPGRLKLGSLVLPPALCKTHPRALKSEAYFGCSESGAPKLTPLTNVWYAAISWRMRFMCQKPAQFVGNGRLFNLFFGFGRTAHWSLRYGPFKSGCRVCACMCMYV
jgi:hypothetical protein